MPNNRRGRINRQVTLRGSHQLADGHRPVRDLTAHILCRHHNNTSNVLDTEGGRFARAIEDLVKTSEARCWCPQMPWASRRYEVDGPLLQRWFLKTAINSAFGRDLPIGSPDVQTGWPSRELVEMTFGRRPIEGDAGLFSLARVGQQFEFREEFEFIYFDRAGTHLAGVVLTFRNLVFGVHFEDRPLPASTFDRLPGLEGVTLLQPFRAFSDPQLNVHLRLLW